MLNNVFSKEIPHNITNNNSVFCYSLLKYKVKQKIRCRALGNITLKLNNPLSLNPCALSIT